MRNFRGVIAKIITFVSVFVISLIVIGFFMNKGNTDMTAAMGSAALPTVSIQAGGTQINLMRGYCSQMEAASMRDSITPLNEQREVEAVICGYGQKIESASYEVRSLDGERLIENTALDLSEKLGSNYRVDFRLKDLIEEGKEYNLIFSLTLEDGRVARYYTQVIQAPYHVQEKLDFIRSFSDATFDYDSFVEQGYHKNLETNAEEKNASLARVTIHSSTKQVTWGGLAVEQVTDPEIQIREIAPQTASVVLSYLVKYQTNGRDTFAMAEEYYRVRYTEERMYLLDYERTVSQFLDENAASFVNDKISLGITDTEVDMLESDGGTVFAFSHAGALYSYNGADGSLARLFSFMEENQNDERNWYDEHGFRILQADETGNVTFIVYGYMNRGRHEGECGVQVCYYSSSINVVEELIFIPYTKSPEILKADMENLSYINGKNDLYLMLDGSIFHVGLENMESDVIAQGLSENSYRVSEDGSMLVWLDEEEDTLVLMNLNSGEEARIGAGAGELIRPLEFMGEDLIYGIASQEDVHENSLGDIIFPMNKILIRDFEGAILKTYDISGVYVTACTIEENQINLERVKKTERGFERITDDQILSSAVVSSNKNYVETAVTENLETVVQIVLRSQVDSKKVKFLTPKEVLFEGDRNVELSQKEHPVRYYVYGKNGICDILSSPAEAAKLAWENAGSVTTNDGSYVFKRDRLYTSNQIMAITGEAAGNGENSLAACLDEIFRFEGLMRESTFLLNSGKDVISILSENLEGRKVLNLKGCSLDMVLYYPDREIPVLAVLEDGSAVLITGFNEKNVVIMEPGNGAPYKMGMNDARSWFEENGNQFIAYW